MSAWLYFLPHSYLFVLKLRESLLKSLKITSKEIVKLILSLGWIDPCKLHVLSKPNHSHSKTLRTFWKQCNCWKFITQNKMVHESRFESVDVTLHSPRSRWNKKFVHVDMSVQFPPSSLVWSFEPSGKRF